LQRLYARVLNRWGRAALTTSDFFATN